MEQSQQNRDNQVPHQGSTLGLPIGSAIGQVTPWGEEPLWGLQ